MKNEEKELFKECLNSLKKLIDYLRDNVSVAPTIINGGVLEELDLLEDFTNICSYAIVPRLEETEESDFRDILKPGFIACKGEVYIVTPEIEDKVFKVLN